MSALCDYAENKLVDHVLGTTTFTKPTNVYLALYTSNPTDTGAAGTEVSGSGYARAVLAFTAGSPASNSGAVSFTASGGNFGTITHFVIRDASTAGNALIYGPLTVSRTINDGETLTFNIGDIVVTFQ